ncbi:fungal-specific transcription factor domain-containing protein [Aspergillus pseudoustus]|uniref:Fungal-specific transcription factor domain-containing protein n=1 Tax=Aspergillus pseudoustus TaxID=1810923 RepID=A0ABR4JXB9_9EURO
MSSRNPHLAACVECRTHKSKCSRERPKCSRCRHQQKECLYPSKISRTPLTRTHLTRVEDRLNKFEIALRALFPSGDVESIVHDLAQGRGPDALGPEAVLPEVTSLIEPDSGLVTGFTPDLEIGISSAPSDNDLASFSTSDAQFIDPTVLIGQEPATALPETQINNATSPFDVTFEEPYINAFFRNYHPAHPFIHEATFKSEWVSQGTGASQKSWYILLNALLALGAWSLGSVARETDMIFYNQANIRLQKLPLMERGDIQLLQALLLLSDFAQKRAMPDRGIQYLAIAVRMSIDLGLHREPPESERKSLLDREIERRIWWSIYIFDSCAAKSFGRPLLLPENTFITTKPVLNIHDEALGPNATLLPDEVNEPTLYSGLVFQAQFHQLANDIYRAILSEHGTPSIEDALKHEKFIDDQQESFPSYIRAANAPHEPGWLHFSRDRLRICDKNIRILIWRPHLLQWLAQVGQDPSPEDPRNDEYRQSAVRCLRTAKQSLALTLQSIRNGQHTRLGGSFLSYCLFQVALVFIVFLKRAGSFAVAPNPALFLQDIRTVKHVLAESWLKEDPQAEHFLNLINQISEPIDPPVGPISETSLPTVLG